MPLLLFNWGLTRLSERSVDPAIGAPLCPVKFFAENSRAYLSGVALGDGTGVEFRSADSPEVIFNWGLAR